MKAVRALVIIVLVASLIGNYLLFNRVNSRRSQMTVNSKTFTKKHWYDWMETRYGVQTMANMARNEIVRQAVEKENLKPDPKEIDETMKNLVETNPQKSIEYKVLKYPEWDDREEIEYRLSLANLVTKDIKATDDELKEYFKANPGKWDKPDKLYLKVMVAQDAAAADKARQLMERVNDMKIVQQQVDPNGKTARIIGVDGTRMIPKPPGAPHPAPAVNQLFLMKPNEVRVLQERSGLAVIKFDRIENGKKVDFEEVKNRVARDFKLTRALPAEEVMRKLWDSAEIKTDNPDIKKQLEWYIFRRPADQEAAQK